MSRLPLMLPSIVALAMVAVAPRALALTQTGQQASEPRTIYTISQKTVDLSPVKVYGRHIPFPIALQLYKTALTRNWSGNPADRHKLVCWWHAMAGTHLQTLFCQTNEQHEKLASATQLAWTNSIGEYPQNTFVGKTRNLALKNGILPIVLANATTKRPIRRGPMAALLAKMPPANSSYTLRVTDSGKPVLDYVIENGELVHIYHYVYKNGEADKLKN